MIRNIIWACISCVILQSVAAQDSTVKDFETGFTQRYAFLSADVISQPFIDVNSYNIAEAGYRQQKGAYRLSQDASSQRDFYFRTFGTKKVKSFLVSGNFGYERVMQDSTGYTLRYDLHGASPYYFYTVKKGHWDVGRYYLDGSISRKILNEKITVAVAGSYDALNAWRSSDPRPEYFDQRMTFSPALHYNFSKNHVIGIGASYNQRKTETAVEYRNDNYSMGSGDYPEYITYIMLGYGRQKNQSTRRNIRSNQQGWGGSALYRGKFAFGEIVLKGAYKQLDTRFFLPGTATGEVPLTYGFFYEDIASAGVNWFYKETDYSINLTADYLNHYGEDLNTEFSANNYIYTLEQIKIRPVYTRYKKGKPGFEVLLDAMLFDLYKVDGSSNVLTDYQVARVLGQGTKYWYIDNKSFLKTSILAGAQLPVSSEVHTPVQTSAFVQGVVVPDAYYYRASSFIGQVDMLYSFPVEKVGSFVRLRAALQQASLAQDDLLPAVNLPGKERWSFGVTVGVAL